MKRAGSTFVAPAIALIVALAYPLILTTPFQQRLGALVLLYAIGASAWNIVGGYAGQISVGHAVFFGCGAYGALASYQHLGWPPIAGLPIGVAVAVLIAAVIGVPTLRLSGHYFSMATIAVAELVRLVVTNTEWLGGAQGLSGPPVPRTLLDLSFISSVPYYYLFLAVLVGVLAVTWADGEEPHRLLPARHPRQRARRARTRRRRAALQARGLHAQRRLHRDRRRALCGDDRLRRSGLRARHPDLGEDADHGGARRRRARCSARWSAP